MATDETCTLKSAGAAGYDLGTAEDILLMPGDSHLAETTSAVVIPKNWVGEITGRSSVESKGIHVMPSVVDHTQNGQKIKFFIINIGTDAATVRAGDRIGQMILAKKRTLAIEIVDYLGETGVFAHGSIKLYSRQAGCILPDTCVRVKSWIEKMDIPTGFYGKIIGSFKAVKAGLFITNGIIDSDYSGPIELIIHNLGSLPFWYTRYSKLGLLYVFPCENTSFVAVDELQKGSITVRNEGGFGSTGR